MTWWMIVAGAIALVSMVEVGRVVYRRWRSKHRVQNWYGEWEKKDGKR